MTDKTMTLEEARARLDRLLRLPTSAAMRSNWIDADEKAALLVLLASEASAVAKVEEAVRLMEPFALPDWSIPEGPGWSAYKLKSDDLRALAAFVNREKANG